MACAPISTVVRAPCWKHAEPTPRPPSPAWKNCSSNFATGKRTRRGALFASLPSPDADAYGPDPDSQDTAAYVLLSLGERMEVRVLRFLNICIANRVVF